MNFFSATQLRDAAFNLRIIRFMKGRSEMCNDMFKLGSCYHSARISAAEKRAGKKLGGYHAFELEEIERICKKYDFDLLSEISEEEMEKIYSTHA